MCNIDIELSTICIGRSFLNHHLKYKDTHLKYIEFGTLFKRFYENEKLHKMGIKVSYLCGMCPLEVDSVEHCCYIVNTLKTCGMKLKYG